MIWLPTQAWLQEESECVPIVPTLASQAMKWKIKTVLFSY